jgi:hypothetical protein
MRRPIPVKTAMKKSDADALEMFIRDHDTRFVPKAMGEGEDASVLLKRNDDGVELTVRTVEEYGRDYIDALHPGPTIEEAWGKWMAEQ